MERSSGEQVRPKRKKIDVGHTALSRSRRQRAQLKKIACGRIGATAQGGSGRFYMSSGGGQTGIHGVRMEDGTKAYAHYNNMELVTLIGIAAGMILLVVGIVTGEMMIIPVVIGFLLIGAYFYLRGIRVAGQKQFDVDNA